MGSPFNLPSRAVRALRYLSGPACRSAICHLNRMIRPVCLHRAKPATLPKLLTRGECAAATQFLRAQAYLFSDVAVRLSVGDEDGRHYGVQSAAASRWSSLRTLLSRWAVPIDAAAPSDGTSDYLAQHQLDDADSPSPLAQLLQLLPPLRHIVADPDSRASLRSLRTNLWLSVGASETNCHYDDEDNVLVVLHGCKVVAVAEPSLCTCTRGSHSAAGAAGTSGVEFRSPFGSILGEIHHRPDIDLFAAAAAAASPAAALADTAAGAAVGGGHVAGEGASGTCGAHGTPADSLHSCGGTPTPVWTAVYTLRPGDALYLPAGYWHQVRSEPRTVAVNYWFEPHSLCGLLERDAGADADGSVDGDNDADVDAPAATCAEPAPPASTADATAAATPARIESPLSTASSWPFVARKVIAAGLDDAVEARLRDWRRRCVAAAREDSFAGCIDLFLQLLQRYPSAAAAAGAGSGAGSKGSSPLDAVYSSLSLLLRCRPQTEASCEGAAAAGLDGSGGRADRPLLAHSNSFAAAQPGPADALLLGACSSAADALQLLLSLAAPAPPSLTALCVSVAEDTWAHLAAQWAAAPALPAHGRAAGEARGAAAAADARAGAGSSSGTVDAADEPLAVVDATTAFEVLNRALRPHADVVTARCAALQPGRAPTSAPLSDLLDVSSAVVRRYCLASLLTGLCGENITVEP